MSEEIQMPEEDVRARRKRKAKKVMRVVSLLATCFYIWLFLMVVRTGYLSWIGILVGVAYVTPGVIGVVAGFAHKPRVEGFFDWLNIGMPILWALAVCVAAVWPVEDGGDLWKPYRFDEELAAIETERAIPDKDNAALRCQTLLASLDVNDEPDFFFRGAFVRDEFYKTPWKGAEHPEVSQWLDTQTGVIDEFQRLAGTGTFR